MVETASLAVVYVGRTGPCLAGPGGADRGYRYPSIYTYFLIRQLVESCDVAMNKFIMDA